MVLSADLQHHVLLWPCQLCQITYQWIWRTKEVVFKRDEMNCNKISLFSLAKVMRSSMTMEWELKDWL